MRFCFTHSIVSSVFLGELVEALLAGPLSDIFGRKPVTLIGVLLIAIIGFASAFSSNIGVFLLLRTLTGVGIGTSAVPYDLVTEVFPRKYRGRVMAAFDAWWCFGSLLTIFFAWLVLSSPHGWRKLVICCSGSVLLSAALATQIPESPRWLLAQGRVQEAEDVVRFIAKVNGVNIADMALVGPKASPESPDDDIVDEKGPFLYLEGPRFKDRLKTAAIIVVWLLVGFSFYGITLLLTREATAGEANCTFDFVYLFSIYLTEVAGLIISYFTIDW